MGLLDSKIGLITGVANDHSIAWGISRVLAKEGAELIFTYLGDAIEKRVRPLAESVDSKLVLPCDLTSDEQIAEVFKNISEKYGTLDFVIHSAAFAKRDHLKGPYLNVTRDGFLLALNTSTYSLTALAKEAFHLMEKNGGSILTLTYYGAEKVVKNYNVMGVAKAALEASVRYLAADLGPKKIRVNALSAGPVKTLAASGITGFKSMMDHHRQNSPLQRNVTLEDVGKTALYLLSDLSSGVTGEVVYVDSGYNVMAIQPDSEKS